jgi:integrase/recombinase XerD
MRPEHLTEQERALFYAGKTLPPLYREYLKYCRDERGLAIGSIHNRKKSVLSFILSHPRFATPSGIKKLRPQHIHDYVIKTAKPLTRDGKRSLVASLRDFFRFLALRDHINKDLSKAVPTIITYRCTTLHRGIPWKCVKEVLKIPDRTTHKGRRDYALLLMFARYGVRAGQLIELRLCDIDWKKQTIFFRAVKHGKAVTAPLFSDVAKALVAYFRGGRMQAPPEYDRVFLTYGGTKGVYRPEKQRPIGSAIWYMIHRHLTKTGFKGISDLPNGSHAIRHAFATRLLEKNEPIKTISDLLGHKSIQTTFIYTKSDMPRLRKLALEWPIEESA